MRRYLLALIAPPAAVWHYGRANATAGPIAVFWVTSIVGVCYGLTGGPTLAEGISWPTVGLAVFLWLASALWAGLVVIGVHEDQKGTPDSTLRHQVDPESYTEDPFKELRR
jgi:hypothetical protein